MSEVIIAGVGAIPVGEHWALSLDNMAAKAMLTAMRDAGRHAPAGAVRRQPAGIFHF